MNDEASLTFTVIEFTINSTEKSSRVELTSIDHEENLTGRHIVAVVGGRLHRSGECHWCNRLVVGCTSRRIA